MATPSWGTYFSKSVWLKVLPKCSLITSGGDSPHGEPKTQPTPNMHIREHVEKEWAEGGGWGAGPRGDPGGNHIDQAAGCRFNYQTGKYTGKNQWLRCAISVFLTSNKNAIISCLLLGAF